jgi:chemotaxis signal transduction protein
MNHIIVTIGKDNLAFPVASVLGVCPSSTIQRIPNLPKPVLGISVTRKRSFPVVEIAKTNSKNLLLILDNGTDHFALAVGNVISISEIPTEEMKAIDLSQWNGNPFADYSSGLWKKDGENFWLINPKKLMWGKSENKGENNAA